ncbi:inorganic phosphate transporter [Thermococcus sp. Bubb.Bath]|uniref:inorganic phosphate transporter n=1 Tax=Thermococcus sp. Bubb.Bath TaxID=1638242 RepID=UPI001438883D|nr:inorganic phosphate transporter [Thermococcus sp. Bubb.Bath]NJF25081.1 inorganic phosphate transporter [Thermococcus sp. Bubb.Bath]
MDPWLIGTIILGFWMAWNIGANDVANSMGTAVGARAVTPKQAAVIAGVMNFTGAYFFGKSVTETIRKGIVNPSAIHDPWVLVYGSLAALLAASIWLIFATYNGLPVSTTHSIVGGVIGYGIVYGGVSIVDWGKVTQVVLSWILSPIFGAIVAFFVFKAVRRSILASKDPVRSARRWAPFWVGMTFVIIGTMFYLKVIHGGNLLYGVLIYGVPSGIAVFIPSYLLIRLRFRPDDPYIGVESIFKKVQIVTSSYVALAHGSNDVANAVGPIAAAYAVITMGMSGVKVPVPRWILAMGGLGIAIGIFMYGYKVMETVGKKITELTNTRGFSTEFSAATVILMASWLGMPISTTHVVVGAVIGVGLARGINAINKNVIWDIIISWFVTVPVAAVISAFLFKVLMMVG